MESGLAFLATAIGGVAEIDIAVLSGDDLGRGVLQLQQYRDRLQVVQARWIAEADACRVWAASGHRDMAAWLAAKGKTSVTAAKKQKALGDALARSPELADAVDAGTITPDTADALQAALASDHSGSIADLVEACAGATPAQAKQAGERFQLMYPPAGSTPNDELHALREKRAFRLSDNGDGTTRADGTFTTFDARTIRDACASVIGAPDPNDPRTFEQKMADAIVTICDAYNKGTLLGGRNNQPTILVTIDINDLNGYTNGPGYTSKGDIVPAAAIRQMVPNARLARILLNDSVVLDMGRSERYATPEQYRALAARDGGCRYTTCMLPPDWCEADHVREWEAEHGNTDIDELVLWCHQHHHYRHRPDVRLLGNANNLAIQHPNGVIEACPPKGIGAKRQPANTTGGTADPTTSQTAGGSATSATGSDPPRANEPPATTAMNAYDRPATLFDPPQTTDTPHSDAA